MAGYVKAFASMLDSSVWQEAPSTRVVWLTMMLMADRSGLVEASITGLADRAKVPLRQTEKAIAIFLSPDPYSKTPDNEGRRIEVVPGRGWRLLNYAHYRDVFGGDYNPNNGTPRLTTKGKIYFVRCGDAIKIGFSQNPWSRLASLKTATPATPELLGYFSGTLQTERDTHERFKHLRRNREWFEAAPDLLAFIATVATGSSRSQLPDDYNGSVSSESGSLSALPSPPAGARSNVDAETPTQWSAWQWRERFGRAWCVKYQRLAYGLGGDADSRATADLAEQLLGLPVAERAEAEARASAMFAEFLADEAPTVVKARHPWSWFVTRFPGLRVPRAAPTAPKKPPSSYRELG